METINKQIENTREDISDFSNPFFLKVYNLHRENSNDTDFGTKMRKLIFEIEDFKKERARKMSDEQLKNITNAK